MRIGLFCNSGSEDIDDPAGITENVLQMATDGYSPSQIASFLGIYPGSIKVPEGTGLLG